MAKLAPDAGRAYRRALWLGMLLVSLHSVSLGLALLFLTAPTLALFGFPPAPHPFFPRQSGAFLVALGLGYSLALAGLERYRGSVLLALISKAVAVAFLFPYALFLGGAPGVLLAGLGDALWLALLGFLALRVYR